MSEHALSDNRHLLVLEPGRAGGYYWRDLWAYRELFAILAWRDVAVRYKQTVIGIAWAVVRPFLTMGVFTVVFGRLANFRAKGVRPIPSWCLPACCRGSCFRRSLARRRTASSETPTSSAKFIFRASSSRLLPRSSRSSISRSTSRSSSR